MCGLTCGLPASPVPRSVTDVQVDGCVWRPPGCYGSFRAPDAASHLCPRRSLDLTGPLLLGGVPNLPEDFPVRNRQFVGCMRNLSVDGKNVDMASFIANNGTRAGANDRRGARPGVGGLLHVLGSDFFLELTTPVCS